MRSARSRRPSAIFLDTQGLAAALNTDDECHAVAVSVLADAAASDVRGVTSDWVLAEFLSLTARRATRVPASRLVTKLRQSTATDVIEATRGGWDLAFELFVSRGDKEWSFVDCTSIVLCRQLGVRDVFSHDHHFAQAGLNVLL